MHAHIHSVARLHLILICCLADKIVPSLSLLHLLLASISLSLIMSMTINFGNDKLYYWTPHPDCLTSIDFVCVCVCVSCAGFHPSTKF